MMLLRRRWVGNNRGLGGRRWWWCLWHGRERACRRSLRGGMRYALLPLSWTAPVVHGPTESSRTTTTYHNNGSIDPVDGRFSLNGPALATSLDSRNHHGEHSERRRQEKEAPERHAISHHYIRPQPRDVTGVPSTSRIPFIYTQILQIHKETASRPSPKCFTPCL